MTEVGKRIYKHAAISSAASADRELVAAVANHRIAVHAYVISSDNAAVGTVRFESAAGGTALTGVMDLGFDNGTQKVGEKLVVPFSEVPWFITDAHAVATDDNLSLEVGASAIAGHIIYSLIRVRAD